MGDGFYLWVPFGPQVSFVPKIRPRTLGLLTSLYTKSSEQSSQFYIFSLFALHTKKKKEKKKP